VTGKVLTLKYRPQTFAELLVQDHVKRTLVKAIERKRLANAYLFAGPRGVGKTTTARILAKSLNCLSFEQPTTTPCNECTSCIEIAASRSMDVLEIDGASNRGIDQVRELRENIKYAPASLRYKVYIIDEVHMLTEHAFNALLKTLEEPPAHVKFVFATTAAHDVPATIISRCQRFDFRKATPEEIADRLRWLVEKEHIEVSEPALLAIARRADGAIRDGESILEQLATYQPEGIELHDAENLLGLVPSDLFFGFVDCLLRADTKGALGTIEEVVEHGHDMMEFYAGLVRHFRSMLLLQTDGETKELGLDNEEKARLMSQTRSVRMAQLVKALEVMLQSEDSAKHSQMLRVKLECLSLSLIDLIGSVSATEPARNKETSAEPAESRAHSAGSKKAVSETGNRESIPDNSPTGRISRAAAPEFNWQKFVTKVRGRKPLLADFLDLCSVQAFADDKLVIACPKGNSMALDKLKADAGLLQTVLASVTGRPTAVEMAPVSDAEDKTDEVERISSVLGEVERMPRRQ